MMPIGHPYRLESEARRCFLFAEAVGQKDLLEVGHEQNNEKGENPGAKEIRGAKGNSELTEMVREFAGNKARDQRTNELSDRLTDSELRANQLRASQASNNFSDSAITFATLGAVDSRTVVGSNPVASVERSKAENNQKQSATVESPEDQTKPKTVGLA